MKKTLLLAAILAMTTSTVFAAETATTAKDTKAPCKCEKPCKCNPPCDCNRPKPPHKDMMGRKSDFDQRLNLTDKQKEQAKALREKGHEEMKPTMDQLMAKKKAKMELIEKKEKTDPELIKLNGEIDALKKQTRELREKNMKEFEKILTADQKKELEKMKQEGRERFEQNKKCPPKK